MPTSLPGPTTAPGSDNANGTQHPQPCLSKSVPASDVTSHPIAVEQKTAEWPTDFAPFIKTLSDAGVQTLDELLQKISDSAAEKYVNMLRNKMPDGLHNGYSAWRLISAIITAHECRQAKGASTSEATRLDPNFPIVLNPHLDILKGLEIPDMDSLFKSTPYDRLSRFVEYVKKSEDTGHLIPDLTTSFSFKSALKRAYVDAGHKAGPP